jgi:hypothetical protein
MNFKIIVLITCVSISGFAQAGTVRVYNNDSQVHTIILKCNGSQKNLEIRASSTASYTFHSSSKECDIVGGSVKFVDKKIHDGQSWEIKNTQAHRN